MLGFYTLLCVIAALSSLVLQSQARYTMSVVSGQLPLTTDH